MPQDWDIFLLSKTNFITYNPLLPEVIGASILPGHVQAPVRLVLKRTRIRMVTVDSNKRQFTLTLNVAQNSPHSLCSVEGLVA